MSDDWPITSDGVEYDGKELLTLVREGRSPFRSQWSAEQLIQEIETHLAVVIDDIPIVTKGSNNYGIFLQPSNGRKIVARLARSDVNMPDFDGYPIELQVPETEFEARVYNLLRGDPAIRPSSLLYYRVPLLHSQNRCEQSADILGRRLLVFDAAPGDNNLWWSLHAESKKHLLDDMACIRASLFRFQVPKDFADRYVHDRLFEFKPESFLFPVEPSRAFWMHVLTTKIEATIKHPGDMIGWESDEEVVGPIAFAAKSSLLRVIPLLFPSDDHSTDPYRMVLELGDFGVHNVTISVESESRPKVTSLFDWETGCIVPVLLSDPLVAVYPVDLIVDDSGKPAVTPIPEDTTREEMQLYSEWADHYIKKLYTEAPGFENAIKSGKDLRHLWFALRDWRGADPEVFFGELGAWAEERMKGTTDL